MTTLKKRISNELKSLEYTLIGDFHLGVFLPLKENIVTSERLKKIQKEYEVIISKRIQEFQSKIVERL